MDPGFPSRAASDHVSRSSPAALWRASVRDTPQPRSKAVQQGICGQSNPRVGPGSDVSQKWVEIWAKLLVGSGPEAAWQRVGRWSALHVGPAPKAA